MVFPRIAALAESAWSPRSKKNWNSFAHKIPHLMEFYTSHNINYAPSAYRPLINVVLDNQSPGLLVHLSPEIESQLYYSTDGSDPTPDNGIPYVDPFPVLENITIEASAFRNGKALVLAEVKDVIVHMALGVHVELGTQPSFSYSAQGGATLVDGQFGGNNWGNGRWLGFLNKNVEGEIHLKEGTTFSKVGYSAIEDQGSGIYFPDKIRVSVSDDGRSFREIAVEEIDKGQIHYTTQTKDSIFMISFPPVKTTYLQIEVIPPQIADKGVFLFVDEIIVK